MWRVIAGAVLGALIGLLLAVIGILAARDMPRLGALFLALGGAQWAVVGAITGATAAILEPLRRLLAMNALDRVGAWGPAATPTLIDLVGNPDWGIRLRVVQALGALGPAVKAAVPALVNRLPVEQYFEGGHPDVLAALWEALKQIDPEAATRAGQPPRWQAMPTMNPEADQS